MRELPGPGNGVAEIKIGKAAETVGKRVAKNLDDFCLPGMLLATMLKITDQRKRACGQFKDCRDELELDALAGSA